MEETLKILSQVLIQLCLLHLDVELKIQIHLKLKIVQLVDQMYQVLQLN